MRKGLSVVIPTYNERENLQVLLPKILDVFKKADIDGEIIVVDDRSNDGSYEYLTGKMKSTPELKVIFRDPPKSISRAWFEGFNIARKKYIVSIDADLCYDPEYLPIMLEKMDNFDVVVGSRYVTKRFSLMKGKPVFLAYLSILGQFIARAITGLTVYDTSSGFRMFKKEIFDAIKEKLKTNGNTFLIEFLYYAKEIGAKITETQIEYGERIYGTTKLKVLREGFRYIGFMLKVILENLTSLIRSTKFKKFLKITAFISLCILLLYSLVKLQKNIIRFSTDGIQRDFSVYYTVGQSLNSGFPLYVNGIVANPPIWDGAATYANSRFAYFPLVAVPFSPVAYFMTYRTAKFFWIYFSLICLIASFIICIYILKLKLASWQYLILGIYASLYFPLLTLIGLGQIEAFLLLLMLTAIALVSREKKHEIASGFIWAFATIIKLHIGLVVLFFIIRKKWSMLAGYLLGGLTIIALTLIFLGPGVLKDYLFVEFPRITQTGGDIGTPETKLPESVFTKYYSDYGLGHTTGLIKTGQWFKDIKFSFSPNASLSRFIMYRLQDKDKNPPINLTIIPFILTIIVITLAYFALRKIRERIPQFSPSQEFLFWYSVLMVIMLLGPVTWAMTAVWIMPISALAVSRHPWSKEKMHIIPWILLVIALIIAFVPDCMYLGWRDFANPSYFCKALDSSKYTGAEILIIISIWLQIAGVPSLKKRHSTH